MSEPQTPDGIAEFKAVCALLGIQTHTRTDTFGRQDLAIDRDGLQKLIDAGLLPEDPSDLPAFAEMVKRRRAEGGGPA